jgi:hypothetical protein
MELRFQTREEKHLFAVSGRYNKLIELTSPLNRGGDCSEKESINAKF